MLWKVHNDHKHKDCKVDPQAELLSPYLAGLARWQLDSGRILA